MYNGETGVLLEQRIDPFLRKEKGMEQRQKGTRIFGEIKRDFSAIYYIGRWVSSED